jgi:hypothetical protein
LNSIGCQARSNKSALISLQFEHTTRPIQIRCSTG